MQCTPAHSAEPQPRTVWRQIVGMSDEIMPLRGQMQHHCGEMRNGVACDVIPYYEEWCGGIPRFGEWCTLIRSPETSSGRGC